MKMNAENSARTGGDYCCVGSKRSERRKEQKRNLGWGSALLYVTGESTGCFGQFLKIRGETKQSFFSLSSMRVDS
jgi:hypothetical protein